MFNKKNKILKAIENGENRQLEKLLKSLFIGKNRILNSPENLEQEVDTPLNKAILYRNSDAIKALLKSGAEIHNEKYTYHSPLNHAASLRRYAIIKLLISAGADVNSTNKGGQTALMSALQKFTRITDEEPDEETPFKTINALLDARIDLNIEDNAGRTALGYASGAITLDKILTHFLECLNLSQKSKHFRPKWYLNPYKENWTNEHFRNSESLRNKAVTELINRGADVNKSRTSWTPLNIASALGLSEIVTTLLKNGAQNFDNALINATWAGNAETGELLLKAGANINIQRDDGKTPLILATIRCNEELVNFLIQKGADKEIRDKCGFTAKIYHDYGLHENLFLSVNSFGRFDRSSSEFNEIIDLKFKMMEYGLNNGVFPQDLHKFLECLENRKVFHDGGIDSVKKECLNKFAHKRNLFDLIYLYQKSI